MTKQLIMFHVNCYFQLHFKVKPYRLMLVFCSQGNCTHQCTYEQILTTDHKTSEIFRSEDVILKDRKWKKNKHWGH